MPSNLFFARRNSSVRVEERRVWLSGWLVVHLLNMAVIGPIQGFWSCCLGFLIRRCDTDCSRIGLVAVDIPLGGAMLVTVVFTQLSLAKSCGEVMEAEIDDREHCDASQQF